MTPDERLLAALAQFRDFRSQRSRPHDLVYWGGEDFVLRHGESFAARALSEEIPYGAPKCCFGNSILLAATRGLAYVEGYALWGGLDLPIHHAWNADDSGRLIDSTWRSEEDTGRRVPMPGAAYLGVSFSVARAYDSIWEGDGSVLDDWQRGWPLFREEWRGEGEPTDAVGIVHEKETR